MGRLYEANGNVYEVGGDGAAHPVDVTAKDKVREVRELESVTVKAAAEAVELPACARPVTVGEVVAKLAVSQRHPARFNEERHIECLAAEAATSPEEPEEPVAPAEPEGTHGEAQG